MKRIIKTLSEYDSDCILGLIMIAAMIIVLCVMFTMGTASLINAIEKL